MAKRQSRSRLGKYAEHFGANVQSFLNRTIEQTLNAGLTAALKETQQDSGLAAYHWIVVPIGGGQRPGGRKLSHFSTQYRGTGVVGNKGEHRGRGNMAVVKAARERERRVITRAVKQRAERYVFFNDVPSEPNLTTGSYADNARIEAAWNAAVSVMNRKFQSAIAAGNTRKRMPPTADSGVFTQR